MNNALRAILISLLSKKIIGGCHTPETKFIASKTKWLDKKEIREFEKEYKDIINNQIILRLKKRTKKSSDWHISLNPKRLKEIYGMLNLGELNE
jgi:hypothetical protein